eukprot:3390432-Pyramimonas_sp.AAC.1
MSTNNGIRLLRAAVDATAVRKTSSEVSAEVYNGSAAKSSRGRLQVYSHDGPIGRSREVRAYCLTTDQSDAGSAGIFSRRTNRTQEVRAYSHNGPVRLALKTVDEVTESARGFSGQRSLAPLAHTPGICSLLSPGWFC